MEEHNLTATQIAALKPVHREFQAAVSVLANNALGTVNKGTDLINHLGGGVCVNGREIAISSWLVHDLDMPLFNDPTPEEVAVVDAIKKAASLFENEGTEAFAPYVAQRTLNPHFCDPLRSLFGLENYIPI